MDAVKFLEEAIRMCEFFPYCKGCKMKDANLGLPCNISFSTMGVIDYGNIVDIVEKWAEEHPAKTRQSEFLKLYPNAKITKDKYINISPCYIDAQNYNSQNGTCAKFGDCLKCMEQYWTEEIEE